MRHRKSGRQLGMNSSARKAMYRNMVTSLLLHEQIRTTETRAKELRRYAERVITMARRAPSLDGLSGDELVKAKAARVHAIRRARNWVHDADVLRKLFNEFPTRFEGRPGGYTRVIRTGRRSGDNAPMAIIALVGPLEADEPADDAVVAAAPAEEAVVEEAPAADDAPAEEAAAAEEAPAEEAPAEDAAEDSEES